MKKILSLLAAASLALLPSCRFILVSDDADIASWNSNSSGERITASDNFLTREETTGEFHSVTCNFPGKIIYTPGDCALSIYAPDNVLGHISVRNEDGALIIKSDAIFRNLKHAEIRISSPVLERITINGAADFQAEQGITALRFEAEVNGAGDLDIRGLKASEARLTVNGAGDADIRDLDCDALTISINGAGDATISGRADRAELSISGAGDIDARSLRTQDLQTKVRGVGKINRPK